MFNYNPKITDLYQENYLKKIKLYSKYSMNKMVFGTVYLINTLSTNSEYSETYLSKVSDKSPIRFTKINNYPIFSLTERSSDIIFDFETGFKSADTVTTCRVMPLKFRFNIGDFLVLNNIDNEAVYEAKESNMKQDLLDPQMQITELTLKLKSATKEEIELQVTDTYDYLFEQDRFIKNTNLSKYNTAINLINIKWNALFKLNFELNYGFLDNSELNYFFSNILKNGYEKISLGKLNMQEQIIPEEFLFDFEEKSIIEIDEFLGSIITLPEFLFFIKLLSEKIDIKLNDNLNLEIIK